MSAKTAWGIAVCLIGPLCLGCAHSPQVIRGQNPVKQAGSHMATMPTIDHAGLRREIRNQLHHPRGRLHNHDHEWLHHNKPEISGHLVNRPCSCQGGWHDASNADCHAHMYYGPFGGTYPEHHHQYRYTPPSGLLYPPSNAPAAVVQYPYYTVKGPSDFFME